MICSRKNKCFIACGDREQRRGILEDLAIIVAPRAKKHRDYATLCHDRDTCLS